MQDNPASPKKRMGPIEWIRTYGYYYKGVFAVAVIVLIVILVKKHVKTFQSDEKPKSDKEVAAEELDRILEPIEDEKAQQQMRDFDPKK